MHSKFEDIVSDCFRLKELAGVEIFFIRALRCILGEICVVGSPVLRLENIRAFAFSSQNPLVKSQCVESNIKMMASYLQSNPLWNTLCFQQLNFPEQAAHSYQNCYFLRVIPTRAVQSWNSSLEVIVVVSQYCTWASHGVWDVGEFILSVLLKYLLSQPKFLWDQRKIDV